MSENIMDYQLGVRVYQKEHKGEVFIDILFPADQPPITVAASTAALTGAVSMMIKSCTKEDMGMKDFELLERVIKQLNEDFVSNKAYDNVGTNSDYIKKND